MQDIEFKYYVPSGESNRRIEPYYLVFQWSSWYVWGWCLERKDYRLFKLNRMDRVAETDKEFACRNAPMPDLSNDKIFPGGIKVNTSNVYLVKDGTLFLLYGRKDFEKMTNRRYEYIKGLNGHFEIALYVDTFEEVDEAYRKAVENGVTSVLEPELPRMQSSERLLPA